MHNLVKIYYFILKILSGNEILMSNEGPSRDITLLKIDEKFTPNNPNLDLVNIKASIILKILGTNKSVTDGMTDNLKTVYPTILCMRWYK